MDNILKFKSKAVGIFDHGEFDLSGFVPEFTPDEEKIEKDILRYKTRNGKKVECNEVAYGDMVTLKCVSDNAKFNKENLVVFVGKALFSKELEEKLVGIEKCKETTLTVGGDTVKVNILKIVRTVLAELSEDELEAVRKQSTDKQLDMFFDENEDVDRASAMLCTEAAENSSFELDDGELRIIKSAFKTEEIGDEALAELISKVFVNTFKNALLGQSLCENEGTLLTQADYEDIIKRDIEANPEMTAEEAKAAYPVFEFMKTRYADRYIKMIDKYIADKFKEVLNK